MKHICRNCHFLTKEYREPNSDRVLSFSLTETEREKAKSAPTEAVGPHYSLSCHMGVWDEGVTGSAQDRDLTINLVERNSICFFFPYHPAMLFNAARELQRRTDEIRQMKQSNFYTRVGLWVAVCALLLNAVTEFLKHY